MRSRNRQRGFWNFVIPAIATVGAALIGANSARRANQMGQESIDQQVEFQREMATTQHQREVADLKAAGLNPILSGTGGFGAASPAGASMQFQNEGLAGMHAAGLMGSTMSSAMQAMKTSSETMPWAQNFERLEREIELLIKDASLRGEQIHLTQQQSQKLFHETRKALIEGNIAEKFGQPLAAAELEVMIAAAKAARIEGQIDDTVVGE